jgi:streptomycin 3"-adenylyltransferase
MSSAINIQGGLRVMRSLNSDAIPKQANQALEIILELFENTVVGVYLYGSAVMGGLRVNSDVDILAIVNQSLTDAARSKLVARLMDISGKIGNEAQLRSLEVTVINLNDVMPWSYPPKKEFIYGEWLRDEYEKGQIHGAVYDSDLTILLAQARENSIPLFGPEASDILEDVPMADIRRAIKDSLPELIESLEGDERNVILTLARMWLTVATGEISSKDVAADWAIPRLPAEQANLLEMAKKAYLGERIDKWQGLEKETAELANSMKKAIETCLETGI